MTPPLAIDWDWAAMSGPTAITTKYGQFSLAEMLNLRQLTGYQKTAA
jgi:hypothetical protein